MKERRGGKGRKGRDRVVKKERESTSGGLREKEREREEREGRLAEGAHGERRGRRGEGEAEMGKDEQGEEKTPTCPGQGTGWRLQRWGPSEMAPWRADSGVPYF